MPLDIQIPDDDLKGFTHEAQDHLKRATGEYATDLIEEANRIEAGRNSTGGPPEVTRGMVNDAKVLLRRGLGAPKKSWGLRMSRVVAAVLSLCAGIMYDVTKLQNGWYMTFFILVVTGAILMVTISTLKE